MLAGLAHLGRAEVFQTSGEGIVAPIPLFVSPRYNHKGLTAAPSAVILFLDETAISKL